MGIIDVSLFSQKGSKIKRRLSLDTRPIFHTGDCFEWVDIKQDLKALQRSLLKIMKKPWLSDVNAKAPTER